MRQQFADPQEADLLAALAGGRGQPGSHVCLAGVRPAQQDHRLAASNELAAGQFQEQRPVQRRLGGEIELEVPYVLGYGERGFPPDIPPKATLHFTVELLDIVH